MVERALAGDPIAAGTLSSSYIKNQKSVTTGHSLLQKMETGFTNITSAFCMWSTPKIASKTVGDFFGCVKLVEVGMRRLKNT